MSFSRRKTTYDCSTLFLPISLPVFGVCCLDTRKPFSFLNFGNNRKHPTVNSTSMLLASREFQITNDLEKFLKTAMKEKKL